MFWKWSITNGSIYLIIKRPVKLKKKIKCSNRKNMFIFSQKKNNLLIMSTSHEDVPIVVFVLFFPLQLMVSP